MIRKDNYGIYHGDTPERISLLKYSKTSCGVDFLLNTAESTEKRGWFDADKWYKTDMFEFFFFRKAEGYLFLSGKRIELHPDMLLIISPFQLQEWHVDLDKLESKRSLSTNSCRTNISCTVYYIATSMITPLGLIWMPTRRSRSSNCFSASRKSYMNPSRTVII